MHRIATGIVALVVAYGGAAAQEAGPGGAVVLRVAPPPGAVAIGPGTPSPDRIGADGVRTRRFGTALAPLAPGTLDVTTPPAGYRSVREDGRDNPLRGPRTLQGDVQTDGIWTRDVPRRLRPVIRVRR